MGRLDVDGGRLHTFKVSVLSIVRSTSDAWSRSWNMMRVREKRGAYGSSDDRCARELIDHPA